MPLRPDRSGVQTMPCGYKPDSQGVIAGKGVVAGATVAGHGEGVVIAVGGPKSMCGS